MRKYLAVCVLIGLLPSVFALEFPLFIGSIGATIEAPRGATIERTVRVTNGTDTDQGVRLSYVPASIGAGGVSESLADDERSLRSWLDLPDGVVIIPPNATRDVQYRVTVPSAASGSYWGGLAVEPVEVTDAGRFSISDEAEIELQVGTRYLGWLFVDVAGTGVVDIRYDTTTVDTSGERVELRTTARNVGDRIAGGETRWDVFNLASGEQVATQRSASIVWYPGVDTVITIPLEEGIPDGSYELVLFTDVGDARVFGRQTTIEIRR